LVEEPIEAAPVAEPLVGAAISKPSIGAEITASSTDSAPTDDPFDPANLRISQDFVTSSGVKRLLTEVPVRKPGPQEFVRVNQDPNYWMAVALIELKDDREFYLVKREIVDQLPGEFVMVNLFTTMNRQGVLSLWPVRLPATDGKPNKWHGSAMDAAKHAMSRWIRVKSNLSGGFYEIFEAASTVPDPVWPTIPFKEILRLAFRYQYVDTLDHPVIKRLRG